MTQGEIRERKLRVAQETRERLRAVDEEIKQNVGKKSSKKPPQTLTSATVKGELEPSKRPSTGGRPVRVSDCPHVVESRVSGECSLGMDDVLVMRSSLESNDGTRRHTDEEGSGCDTAALDASISRLWKSDAVSTNLRQEADVSSVAIDFSNAEGLCAYHLLRNHLLHCLCPRARRRSLQRFRQRKWMSIQSASACGMFQPTHN